MRHTKRIFLTLGVAAVLAGGGFGVAAATGSSSTAAPSKAAQPAAAPGGSATINVTSATSGGKSEQILVDARGLPLYTYGGDSSTVSRVSGGLAALWPPLVSGAPSETGATGKLTVLVDSNGQQVLYNGHFLYTFVNDSPGQVTGDGVQDFFVATPGLSSGAAKAAPSPAPTQGSSYGY
jgi:predicted lipoprotein with Yx(FWY)xxD motif